MWASLALIAVMGGLLLWSFRAGKKSESADNSQEALDEIAEANTVRANVARNLSSLRDKWIR